MKQVLSAAFAKRDAIKKADAADEEKLELDSKPVGKCYRRTYNPKT